MYRLQLKLSVFMLLCGLFTHSQDLGQIGKAKLFKTTGGIAANVVGYEGAANRAPFTYFLTGAININVSGVFNVPLSFSYSNLKFTSSNPFSFNRLSIHPSYKWVTTHIGDVSMTFSPYTLNGHQFTGFGADLTPEGPLQFSVMYGRLLEASEFNTEDAQSEPAFKRIGYGFKTHYKKENYGVGVVLFKAKDDENSIENPVPLELEVQPQENIVASLEANVQPLSKLNLALVYASSVITENLNTEGAATSSVLGRLIDANASTNTYKAYNATVSYQIGQGTVGAGYEYIDPQYRTFGAYFFNNDLEHVTVNATQAIFNNKVTVAVNGGIQRDDLDNTKSSQLQRVVSAVNIGYTPNEKLNIATSYSSFQSFTNIKNQFERINEVNLQASAVDTLDFQQISQNATLNTNYTFKATETKTQNLNLDVSYQEAVSRQGGTTTANGDSKFYNASTSYALGYPAHHFSISAAFNATYNTIAADESIIFGPSLAISKQFLEKKLRTTSALSYNQSQTNGSTEAEVANLRLNGAYTLKEKHNLTLSVLTQLRTANETSQDFTVTFGYNYTFDNLTPGPRQPKRKKTSSLNDAPVQFTYRDSVYGKTQGEIYRKLVQLQTNSHFAFIPKQKKEQLTAQREALATLNHAEEFKLKAIAFLDDLYSYEDFVAGYDARVFSILTELGKDMKRLDYTFEKSYVRAAQALENHGLHKRTVAERATAAPALQNAYNARLKHKKEAQARLVAHRWMLPLIEGYTNLAHVRQPDAYLKAVMTAEKEVMYEMKENGKTKQEIELYLISKMIAYYCKVSVEHTDPEDFELKY